MVQVKRPVLTISDLARRTGAAPSALRFYERRGLLRPVGRSGGKRTYAQEAVAQVAVIDLLKQAGFTLTEIAGMLDADGRVDPGWRDTARAKLTEIESHIAFAQRAKMVIEHTIACPHPTPDECPVFRRHVADHIRSLEARAGN